MILSPIQPTDPIIGPSRGAADGWIDWITRHCAEVKRPDDAIAFIRAVYELCAPDTMPDAFIVVAQSFHETGNYTSQWWAERLNPAGIGVTGDDTQNAASPTFATPMQAARAQIAHLLLYALGAINRGGLKPSDDPRYLAYRDEYGSSVFSTLQLLSGRWAADPFYANKIADRAESIYQEDAPVTTPVLTFGKVAPPKHDRRIAPKPYDGAGFTRLDHPRRMVGRCGHITDGEGSLDFYYTFFSTGGERALDALVDLVIDKQGNSIVLNDFTGTRMPWANGGSDGLEGDGPLFVRTLGIGMINEGLVSMERVGVSPAKMTDAQLETSARWTAYIFDQSQVAWSDYPFNPHAGCVTDMLHFEFATKPCPGDGMRGQINAEQNRARAIMKQAQEGESQADVPPPHPIEQDHDKLPAGIDWSLIEGYFGTGTLHRVGKRDGRFKFHRGRAWSEAYIARAVKEQVWPEVQQWNQYRDAPGVTREIITWKNGWVLVRLNAREGWHWA